MKQLYANCLHAFHLLLFLLLSLGLSAQTVQWAHTLRGNYSGNIDLSAVDEQDNIFVHGEYTGTVRHGATNLAGAYPATYDRVLLKYGHDRTPLWYKKNKGFVNGIPTVGITDRQGNYYELSGYTNGVFDNTIVQPTGTTAYLTKYAPTGARQWIKFMKGGFLYPAQLFLDTSGRLVFSVNVEGELWYDNQRLSSENKEAFLLRVDTGNGAVISQQKRTPYTPFRLHQQGYLYETGMHQAPLVRKLDAAGQQLWQKNLNGTSNTFIRSMEADQEGNVYVSGTYCGRLTIDQLELTAVCQSQQSGAHVFLAKFDKDGNAEWLKGLGQYYMGGNTRLLPHPEGGLYLAGINGTNTLLLEAPIAPGIFIARLTEEGEIVWLRSFGADFQFTQLSLKPLPNGQSGLIFASALPGASTRTELDLDGHKVTKEAGNHTFFFAYLKDESCAPKPQVQEFTSYCAGTTPPVLHATGQNIRWYREADRSTLLGEGNEFHPGEQVFGFLYVTQTIQGCESQPRRIELRKIPRTPMPLAGDKIICEGQLPVLVAQGQNLRWYADASLGIPIDTDGAFTPVMRGRQASYYVTQTIDGCESPPREVKVEMKEAPPAPVVNSTYVCDGVLQEPLLAEGAQVTWYADAARTKKIGEGNEYFPEKAIPGKVYVTQRLEDCESMPAIAEIKAGHSDFHKEKIANIITPNGDGLNDAFTVTAMTAGSCIGKFKRITIFNRWGKSVFENEQPDFRWDASGQTDGVYFYLLTFENFTYRGNLTVTR